MTEIRLQNPYMDETIKVKVYYDNVEDSEHVFQTKNEAINELHRLGLEYRNAKKYKVEMVEYDG